MLPINININRENIINYIVILAVIAVSFSWFLFDTEKITLAISEYYNIGLLIYAIYVATSVVFVTFPVMPLLPFIYSAYGFQNALLFTFIGINVGGYVAFLLSRRLGRKVVIDKVGESTYNKYEKISDISRFYHFLILRIIANNYYDVVSYAAGLSKVSHKDYLIASGFSSLIWLSITFELIDWGLARNKEYAILLLSLFYIIFGAIAIFLLGKFLLKIKLNKPID